MSIAHFGDEVISRCRALGHPLCVGLDPHLNALPKPFRQGSMEWADPDTAPAVEGFFLEVLHRLAGRVAIVKPQIALFEQLGVAGLDTLTRLCRRAKELGLLVLMDAKRGDIGSTAAGYASAYLAEGAPFESDALTVNPYMGVDTVEPYLNEVQACGRGVFVLVKTSNPGSTLFQDLEVEDMPLFAHVASGLHAHCEELRGGQTGWSSLGVVVGATYPEQGAQVRELLPNALFLIPGYGAQGGSAKDAVGTFVRGTSGLEGGLVNSSRGILFPKCSGVECTSAQWESGFEVALSQAIDDLGQAVC